MEELGDLGFGELGDLGFGDSVFGGNVGGWLDFGWSSVEVWEVSLVVCCVPKKCGWEREGWVGENVVDFLVLLAFFFFSLFMVGI